MEHMNDTEQLSLSERLKNLEDIILVQHSEIQNLLEAMTGLAKLVATLREAQAGHQRIFASMHALMVQGGLISETEPPPIVN
jgi:1-deoxy-D-xylulose 5-phosphate reductoisomerase